MENNLVNTNNQEMEVVKEKKKLKTSDVLVCIAAGTLAVSGCVSLYKKVRRNKTAEAEAQAFQERVIADMIRNGATLDEIQNAKDLLDKLR